MICGPWESVAGLGRPLHGSLLEHLRGKTATWQPSELKVTVPGRPKLDKKPNSMALAPAENEGKDTPDKYREEVESGI
jgi:hypothetical protein